MRGFLTLQRWHIGWLFSGLSASAVIFAWTTFNLYQVASSNIHFISNYGVMGLVDGGFLQLVEISLYGLLSLAMFLLFKGCENEIMQRWRDVGKS